MSRRGCPPFFLPTKGSGPSLYQAWALSEDVVVCEAAQRGLLVATWKPVSPKYRFRWPSKYSM